jgi:hypothetical protein
VGIWEIFYVLFSLPFMAIDVDWRLHGHRYTCMGIRMHASIHAWVYWRFGIGDVLE